MSKLWISVIVLLLVASMPMRTLSEENKNHSNANPSETDQLAANLETKQAELIEKEKQIEEKEAWLKQQEAELDKKLKKLEGLRTEISTDIGKQKKNNEERLAKMVVVFEAMTPKSTASVLETLDDWLSIEILKRMDSKRMAKVMNIMNKSRSARLSELLTGYGSIREPATGQVTKPSEQGNATQTVVAPARKVPVEAAPLGAAPVASSVVSPAPKPDGANLNTKEVKP